MKKTITTLCLFFAMLAAVAQERPKLVVGIVVDQMRWDYLYRYYDLYGNDGFKRMMGEGFSCENTMINYVPAVTAVGHTSIFTGAVPSVHGIVSNHFFIDGRRVYCTTDTTEQSVGTTGKAGRMSPRNLLTTTIGDELKIATDFNAKVVGVAIKDRAAILPAGHAADAAYWLDDKARCFVSSTYYMQQLPDWAVKFNKTIKNVSKDEIGLTPYGNLITEEMAKAAVAGEKLGQRGTTDMLTVSFSCTDKLGHKIGTHNDNIRDMYVELDKRIADLMGFLDTTVGKGEYIIFLTADHGASNSPYLLEEHKIPTGMIPYEDERNDLNKRLSERFGTAEKLVTDIMDYKVCIDRNAVKRASLDFAEVKKAVMEICSELPYVQYVIDLDNVANATVPALIREKVINGYLRQRGGDVQLIFRSAYLEGWHGFDSTGTTHGAWNPYDAHIPFIIAGWHVPHGATHAQTHITDIAPTVCAIMHVQMPSGCVGTPVVQITK